MKIFQLPERELDAVEIQIDLHRCQNVIEIIAVDSLGNKWSGWILAP
ncbi:MAG: hypothetical protein WDO73_00580 [Ignavibacteriota bacterium]